MAHRDHPGPRAPPVRLARAAARAVLATRGRAARAKGRENGRKGVSQETPFLFKLAPPEARPENIRVRSKPAALLLAFALTTTSAAAQKTATVIGAVVDSLHGRWLAGAEVTLTGTTALALTDSLGRFRFDSVQPGIKQVGVFHPLLDSLGISIGSRPFPLGSDSIAVLGLSVPSPRTLLRQLCNLGASEKVSGVIMGRVVDPDTGSPVPASRVSFHWTEYEITRRKSVKPTQHGTETVTDQSGSFRACRLPMDLPIRMRSERNGSPAPELDIEIGAVPIVVTDVAIREPGSNAVGVVQGRLTDSAGVGVSGAYVGIERLKLSTMTDSSGRFSITGAATGTQVLVARKIGFTSLAYPVLVTSRQSPRVSFSMARAVPVLEDVRVLANSDLGLARIGFTERKARGLGNFLLAADIEKQKDARLSEILGRVPGLSLDASRGRGYIKTTRDPRGASEQACIRLYIDGTEWITSLSDSASRDGRSRMALPDASVYVDGIVIPSRIGAVEIYHPLEVPGEYSSLQNCTTILIWTKFKILKAQ